MIVTRWRSDELRNGMSVKDLGNCVDEKGRQYCSLFPNVSMSMSYGGGGHVMQPK